MKKTLSITVLVAASAFARADVRWSLTTPDFQTQQINLVGMNDAEISYVDVHSVEKHLPLGSVAGLRSSTNVSTPPAGTMRLVTADGSIFVGTPAGLKDEQVSFSTALFGDVSLPLKQVVQLESTGKPGSHPTASATEDIVQLLNGDAVHGVVENLSKAAVTVKTDAGDTDVPISTISAVVFASTGGAAAKAPALKAGYRVMFDDGSVATFSAVNIKGGTAQLKMLDDAPTRSTDLDHVIAIDPLFGPVRWLSAMTPTITEQTSFLDLHWPTKMDASVTGGPIRSGDRLVGRGIGVHAASRLTWPLDGGYKYFRTQVAIDGDLPMADADVKILLDGKVVNEIPSLRAGSPSPIIWLELGAAKTITLQVDNGAGYDVQDRVDWIEPALVKEKPVMMAPATQP